MMHRFFIWMLVFAAGSAIGYILGARDRNPPASPGTAGYAPRNIAPAAPLEVFAPPPKLSASQVQDFRDDNYRDMTSLDDVLDLPNDFTQTEALYALAGRADIATLQSYIGQAAAIANRHDRRAALYILFLRYSELDANAALEYLASIDLDIELQIVYSMFESWAKEDINAAIAAANAMPDAGRRRRAGTAILQAYAQIDPGMLGEVSARLSDAFDTALFEAQAIGIAASHSPQLAVDQALALAGHTARYRALSSVAHVWARTDPQAALAHAATIPDTQSRETFVNAVVSQWVQEDAQSAVSTLLALPEGQQKNTLVTSAAYQLAALDPQLAYSMAQALTGSVRDTALHRVIDRWAQMDPAAAVAILMTHDESAQKNELFAIAGRHYAERDPAAALAWAAQLPHRQRDEVYTRILGNVARHDPAQAMAVATSIDGPQRSRMIKTVLQSVAQHQPAVAASYVDQLPAGELRRHTIGAIASNWATRDVGATLDWLGGFDSQTYDQTIAQLSYQIAQRDPDAAAAYLDRIRPAARERWIGSVASVYARNDPQRAIDFANSFANDPFYDAGMMAVVSQLAYSDPMRAIQLTDNIDTQKRPAILRQVVNQWAMQDPAAAARWVDTSTNPAGNDALLTVIARNWGRHDAHAATDWALSRPPGATRDRVLLSLLEIDSQATDRLVRVVRAINDQAMREQASINTYLHLLNVQADPARAAAFLARSGLSTEQRRRLEAQLSDGSGG